MFLSGPCPVKGAHLKLTQPHSPHLLTRQRSRPPTAKTSDELDAEEVDKLQKYGSLRHLLCFVFWGGASPFYFHFSSALLFIECNKCAIYITKVGVYVNLSQTIWYLTFLYSVCSITQTITWFNNNPLILTYNVFPNFVMLQSFKSIYSLISLLNTP